MIQENQQKCENEVKSHLMAAAKHGSIINIKGSCIISNKDEFGLVMKKFCILMENFDIPLSLLIDKKIQAKQNFELKEIIEILKTTSNALFCLQSNDIAHRNINLFSIFYSYDQQSYKLGEFQQSANIVGGFDNSLQESVSSDFKNIESVNSLYQIDVYNLGLVMLHVCDLEYNQIQGSYFQQGNTDSQKIDSLNNQIQVTNQFTKSLNIIEQRYCIDLRMLIQMMLHNQPEQRPTFNEIVQHCISIEKEQFQLTSNFSFSPCKQDIYAAKQSIINSNNSQQKAFLSPQTIQTNEEEFKDQEHILRSYDINDIPIRSSFHSSSKQFDALSYQYTSNAKSQISQLHQTQQPQQQNFNQQNNNGIHNNRIQTSGNQNPLKVTEENFFANKNLIFKSYTNNDQQDVNFIDNNIQEFNIDDYKEYLSNYKPIQEISNSQNEEELTMNEDGQEVPDIKLQRTLLDSQVLLNYNQLKENIKEFGFKEMNFSDLYIDKKIKLGEGSEGVIFACSTKLKKFLAVKIYQQIENHIVYQLLKNQWYIEQRFKNQVVNIEQYALEQVDQFSSILYVVTKRYSFDLQKALRSIALNLTDKISIATQLINTLYAFQNDNNEEVIVHGDIKPTNIMITDKLIVHLTDFSISTIFQKQSILSSQGFTFLYSSPEQVLYNRMEVYSDIWAIGIVFYELFFGVYIDKKIIQLNGLYDSNKQGYLKVNKSLIRDQLHQQIAILIGKMTQFSPLTRINPETLVIEIGKINKKLLSPIKSIMSTNNNDYTPKKLINNNPQQTDHNTNKQAKKINKKKGDLEIIGVNNFCYNQENQCGGDDKHINRMFGKQLNHAKQQLTEKSPIQYSSKNNKQQCIPNKQNKIGNKENVRPSKKY